MLGLRFNPDPQAHNALWVLDFGAGMVLNVDPQNGNASPLTGVIPGSGLNALTFDSVGNGYVSDSFNGKIWKIPSNGGSPTAMEQRPLLLGNGTPVVPFGASRRHSGQMASSSATTARPCSSPTPRFTRSSRSR